MSYLAFLSYEWESPGLWATAVSVLTFFLLLALGGDYSPHVKGTKHVGEECRGMVLAAGDPGLPWGGKIISTVLGLMYFLILGAVGSGKTKIMESLMKTFLPTLNLLDGRALILDPKHEFYRYIDSLDLGVRTIIFDPTDVRCASWKVAEDILDEDDAGTLAEIFVLTNERASQPFFDDAARALLRGVVEAHIRTMPKRWTLRHIVYCMRSMERIKALLKTTDEGKDLIQQYLSKEKLAQDIMATVATKIGRFKTVAKSWHRAEKAGRTVSIEEWMRGNFIILLGSSNKAAATVQAVNQLFFKRLSQVILDEPDNDQANLLSPSSRRHYLFLDEIHLAGRLEGLNELFLKGRSKGGP
jgi:type IV secretory pathway TraG/TraD family ATPase VirD4